MIHEIINISWQGYEASITIYILDNFSEMDENRIRPMILICPGGGYRYTSDREAEPVAVKMNSMGFHAAVLRYSCAPAPYAAALSQLCMAMDCIHDHAGEWHVDTDKVIVAGGSAGGHLALSLGVYWNKPFMEEMTGIPADRLRPSGLILSYPVVRCEAGLAVSNEMAIRQDERYPQLLSACCLDSLIENQVPPVFVWHTYTDQLVTVRNSLWLAERLEAGRTPMELHIYPEGPHGLSLGTMETYIAAEGFGYQPDVQNWITMAGRWVRGLKTENNRTEQKGEGHGRTGI